MEAKELRIGNLVNITEKTKEDLWDNCELSTNEISFDVSRIEETELMLYIEKEEIEFYCKEILPISLTEEWLINLGFKKDDIKEFYYIDCNEYKMEVVVNAFSGSMTNNPSWFVSINPGYGSQSVTLVKKDVHQLQNLYFALTGKELEFRNIKCQDKKRN